MERRKYKLDRSLPAVLPLVLLIFSNTAFAQKPDPGFRYTVSIPKPENNIIHVELITQGWAQDTVNFKMPAWMPGYYQLMNYADDVTYFEAKEASGKPMHFQKPNSNTWRVTGTKNKKLRLVYEIKTHRKFVANSYADSSHAYIIPGNNFLYADGYLNRPASVKIVLPPDWKDVVTGLDPVPGKSNDFKAENFDILYDCPLLMGNLEKLSSFYVKGIEHRFIGYEVGKFDKEVFMGNLKKVVEAAAGVIGDIPYKQYTFIAIGPGQGGIEHLNNTTVSFSGKQLGSPQGMNRIMNFLAHEYFHHYNVKRIRPYELGPFDYDQGSKTNLLWVSEGLSVYYEYLVVRRAGLTDEKTLLADLERNINNVENNPGRLFQSLTQASYNTWKEGPFGTQGDEPGKSISYYEKGPIIGLLLDMEIRASTANKKSLDDVMRYVYYEYYKRQNRGFTDAEFQQACEAVAGKSLASIFEYVYTTKEIDYNTFLNKAGLKLYKQTQTPGSTDQKQKFVLLRIDTITPGQEMILSSWQGK